LFAERAARIIAGAAIFVVLKVQFIFQAKVAKMFAVRFRQHLLGEVNLSEAGMK